MNFDRLVVLILVAGAAAAMFSGLRLPFWTDGEPGAGMFPVAVALVTVCLGLAVFVRETIKGQSAGRGHGIDSGWLVYAAAIVGLLISCHLFGFWPPVPIFFYVILRHGEGYSRRKAMVFSAAATVFLLIAFQYGMGVALPDGIVWDWVNDFRHDGTLASFWRIEGSAA